MASPHFSQAICCATAKAGKPVACLIGYSENRSLRVGEQWQGLVHIRDDVDQRITYEINDADIREHDLTPTDQFEIVQHVELLDMPITEDIH